MANDELEQELEKLKKRFKNMSDSTTMELGALRKSVAECESKIVLLETEVLDLENRVEELEGDGDEEVLKD